MLLRQQQTIVWRLPKFYPNRKQTASYLLLAACFLLFQLNPVKVQTCLITAFTYVSAAAYKFVFAEIQRNTPYCRQSDYDIENTTYNAVAAPKRPRYKIKLENSHQAPVKTAYKHYTKSNFIHHFNHSFLYRFALT